MKSNKIFFGSFLGTISAILFVNLMTFIEDPTIYYLLLGVVAFVILIFMISGGKNEDKNKKIPKKTK